MNLVPVYQKDAKGWAQKKKIISYLGKEIILNHVN